MDSRFHGWVEGFNSIGGQEDYATEVFEFSEKHCRMVGTIHVSRSTDIDVPWSWFALTCDEGISLCLVIVSCFQKHICLV